MKTLKILTFIVTFSICSFSFASEVDRYEVSFSSEKAKVREFLDLTINLKN